ncbi:MAG TPA: ABC transporter permease/substrate-binding protein [Micropepsaceae bacterium]|nr:ABC transporter permease/substrate-binding protein [Micropepsaceae bacterium]
MEQLAPRLSDALAHLPDYLGAHVLLSASALLLGLFLSAPLSLAALRWRNHAGLILGGAAVIQTIPSLALLALFYPLLLLLSSATRSLTGAGFSALGFLPSLLALSLYSMLPILRNTVTGILGVDAAVKEAALGAGMTPFQTLIKIELPLALPVIMAGIRTASVLVIGTATLSTPVGQTSLGNYIFSGLQTQNWVDVLVGCVAAALLALVVDRILALLESIARGRGGRQRLAAASTAIALILCAGAVAADFRSVPGYVIGAKGFPEQYILAALIDQRLTAAGLNSSTRNDLGSALIFRALTAGDVDVYVDYTGTIWTNEMHRRDTPARNIVLEDVSAWVREHYGARVLGPLGFENAYVLAMRRDKAESLGVRSIADLAPLSPSLTVGGDYEIFRRPEWQQLHAAYGLDFKDERQMQPLFMYKAVADGDVDAITAFSSDGRIAQYGLVTLADPKNVIPPYDAILLLSPRRSNDRALISALHPLIGKIDVEKMRGANLAVSRENQQSSPASAARDLWREISGGGSSE